MTKAELHELARQASEAEIYANGLAMTNRPTDIAEQIEIDAAYKIARDVALAKHRTYSEGLREWIAAGYPE